MWLLKFHITFSLLCQLSFIGVVVAFKDRLRRFQTEPKGKKKKKKYLYWLMFFLSRHQCNTYDSCLAYGIL